MSFEGVSRENFDNLVDKSNQSGHWYWRGSKTSDGIPYMWLEKQAVRAYRVAWGLYKDEPAVNKTLRRSCDDSQCIAPDHRECVEIGEHTKGAKHGQAKLTEADVIDIRERYENGERQAAIARAKGISQAQVSMIVNKRMWTHVG